PVRAGITRPAAAPPAATAAGAFPADEPPAGRGRAAAEDRAAAFARPGRVLRSPARAAAETATALGLERAEPDPLLRDQDPGRWAGRTLDEVAAAEPEAIGTWLTDPAAAPHGGESVARLLERAAAWLGTLPGDGHLLAVTHAAVVRAVLLDVLGAPADRFWRIDVAPLTVTVLRGGPGRWTLRSTGAPPRST
ncbi:MAG: histidine phosphatase family protein, partial [Pseudonocardia sp.]|nr:histidine phosphatase family protein [Pseudonocardia sp.]